MGVGICGVVFAFGGGAAVGGVGVGVVAAAFGDAVVGIVIVGELAMVSGDHGRDRRDGCDFKYGCVDGGDADCGAVFQFHDFVGGGADACEGEKGDRYDCDAAARDTGVGICVCVDGGGDCGCEVGAMGAVVPDDWDHHIG